MSENKKTEKVGESKEKESKDEKEPQKIEKTLKNEEDPSRQEIVLHLYDLSGGYANKLSVSLTGEHFEGIWHTGTVVYNYEYFWSGDIMRTRPARTTFGIPTKIVKVGHTSITRSILEDFIKKISSDYTVTTYTILSNNCNNFTSRVLEFLTGKPLASDVLCLPQKFLGTKIGQDLCPLIVGLEEQMKRLQTAATPLTLDRVMASHTSESTAADESQWSLDQEPEVPLGISYPFIAKKGNATTALIQFKESFPSLCEPTTLIDELIDYSKKQTFECTTPPSRKSLNFLINLLLNCEEIPFFFIASAFRFFIICPSIAYYLIVKNVKTLDSIINRFLTSSSSLISQIGFSVICNIFFCEEGQKYMVKFVDAILAKAVPLLISKESVDLRRTCAALVYNCCFSLTKLSQVELISTTVPVLSECEKDTEIAGRLLLSFSRVLFVPLRHECSKEERDRSLTLVATNVPLCVFADSHPHLNEAKLFVETRKEVFNV